MLFFSGRSTKEGEGLHPLNYLTTPQFFFIKTKNGRKDMER